MKHTKFWSCLLAVILLISCAAGIFVIGADAENTVVYYTLGEVELEGATNFETLAEALDALRAKNKKWGANESVEIQFQGDISGGAQDGILFGLTTIWREDNTKLPITFRGVDKTSPRDAYIYLDAAGGWYACANDYTFINLTLPVGDQKTEFYAGSGNVRFENVYFKEQNITIPTSAEQAMEHRLKHEISRTVAARNNADVIPAGDAWFDLIQNNPDVGNNLSRSLKKDRPQGDYKHDGDIGGGMYLNACVWYEVLTKKSCVGHTWKPTEDLVGYTISDELIAVLQVAAHNAVVAEYGEDYYDDKYSADLNKDGELNILNIGSSNGYYYVDELSQMLNADGLTARVCTAYHSGVKISTQWTWAAGTAKGDYQFRIYEADTNTAEEISNPDAKGVNFDYFQTKFAWDSITFYQTSGPFDDYGLTEEKHDYAYEKALATCDKADNLYAFMRQTNPDARYTWYQVCPVPVGYPGVSSSLDSKSGSFYADNCTQEVFAGWPELAAGEKVQTSLTFGPGTDYYNSDDSMKYFISAVGYMADYKGEALTDETAAEVKYMEADENFGEVADIRPIDLEASIILDGGRLYRIIGHYGYAPTDVKVRMHSGSLYRIDGDNSTSSTTESFYGDIDILVDGGTVTSSVYGTYGANIKGDLKIEVGGDAVVNSCIRGTFSAGTIDGNVYLTVSGNAQIKGSNDNRHAFYGGGNATGEIVNTVSGGTITGVYFGIRHGGKGKTIVNNISGGVIDAPFYGGHFATTAIGQIINNFSGGTITGSQIEVTSSSGKTTTYNNIYAGSYSSDSGASITGLPVEIDGKTVTASIVNNISGTTFGKVVNDTRSGYFYGSSVAGAVGDIYNIITGGTFQSRFYGSASKKAVGNVTTKISGSAAFESDCYSYGYDDKSANSDGKTVTTVVKGGTFKTFYPSGQILYNRVSNITIEGGTFNGFVYNGGYNGSAKEINCTIKGGTFNSTFYGGIYNASETINPKKINLTIEGGTFNDYFYGGSRGVRTGDVHVIVRGNPVFKKNFSAGSGNKVTGDLTTADIVTGNVTLELYGGTFQNVYSGSSAGTVASVTTIVDGATVNGVFYGAYGGTMGDVETSIKSGTFNGKVYMGPWGGSCTSVTSNISGGTFNSVTQKDSKSNTVYMNSFNGGGAGEIKGNITNNITGGTFKCHAFLGSTGKVGGSVINNVSGGTFELTSCGAGKGTITGNVENTISGTASFKKGFYGGYSLSYENTITGNIINKVEQGPQSDLPYFGKAPQYYFIDTTNDDGSVKTSYKMANSEFGLMGANNKGDVGGYVENHISGGYFAGHWHGGGNDGDIKGKNENGDAITNKISGGTFAYRAYGGMVSGITLAGNIRNEITGGLFKYEFAASHRAGAKALTTTTYSLDIYTHISGNPVFEKYICGVARGWNVEQSARVRLLGDVVLTIEGGTFKAGVYGLCNNGEYHNANMPGARIDEGGSVTININGGTFAGVIYATSPNYDASLYHETGIATVNFAPTKGDVILRNTATSRFANEKVNLAGGDYKILLGADAKIEATSASGDVKIGQDGTWKKQVYVTLPEGNTAKVTVDGAHVLDKVNDSVVAVKGGIQLYGATLILTDRVAVRALFDKASVEGIDDFTFTFKMGDVTLAEGGKSDLEIWEKDANYYCIVLAKVGAKDFTKTVTLAGDYVWDAAFSIEELADLAEEAWAGNAVNVNLAKALHNFATLVSDPAATLPNNMTPDLSKIEGFVATATKGSGTLFTPTGKGLVMGNAVGIRIYGTATSAISAENLVVKVNGKDVTDKAVFGEGIIDLYVNAKNMSNQLKIEIVERESGSICLTLIDRVDAIAASYPETHEKYALAQQLLVYIQAAVEYANQVA